MTIEAVLEKLEGVRPNRGGWIARCPAHADRSPSLSIRESDEKILIHCFAGCTANDVCNSIGIRVADLFYGRQSSSPPVPETPTSIAVRNTLANLYWRLTPRERRLLAGTTGKRRTASQETVKILICTPETVDGAIVRALILGVEFEEIVQVALIEGENE